MLWSGQSQVNPYYIRIKRQNGDYKLRENKVVVSHAHICSAVANVIRPVEKCAGWGASASSTQTTAPCRQLWAVRPAASRGPEPEDGLPGFSHKRTRLPQQPVANLQEKAAKWKPCFTSGFYGERLPSVHLYLREAPPPPPWRASAVSPPPSGYGRPSPAAPPAGHSMPGLCAELKWLWSHYLEAKGGEKYLYRHYVYPVKWTLV